MTARSYDSDQLWMKSRLFISRALDGDGDFPEDAFWAACALELLAKSFLASLNPLLIATPTDDDGHSLLVASGILDDTGFTSIAAKAIWARTKRVFPSFKQDEAKRIGANRNTYIHSGRIGFDLLPAEVWWARYWSVVAPLLSHYGKEVHEFVGLARSQAVEESLRRNTEIVSARLEALKERALARRKQYESDGLSVKLAAEWAAFRPSYYSHETEVSCPACANPGVLQGDESIDKRIEYEHRSYDPFEYDVPTVWLVIATESFACPYCHLRLEGSELTDAAGLPDSFEVEGSDEDLAEPEEYMNE